MIDSTTSSDGNKLIQKKLESWSHPPVAKQWVDDKVDGEIVREKQRKHLHDFWKELLSHSSSNKFDLIQSVWVLLSFPEQAMTLVEEIEAIRETIKPLHPALRSHIQFRLLEEFLSLKDEKQLLSQLDTPHESFKSYWKRVFEISSLIILIHTIAKNLYQKNVSETEAVLLSEQCHLISNYFYQMSVSPTHDVMDSVIAIDSLLVQGTGHDKASLPVGIDKDAIESISHELCSVVHEAIKSAYAKMPSCFEGYDILGSGFRLSNDLIKKIEIHHTQLKLGVTSFEAFLNGWRRLLGQGERTQDIIANEREFIHKILSLHQAGCLNLNLLNQCWNANPDLPVNGSGKTKTLFLATVDELKQGLMMRAKESQGALTLRMDAHHPLLQTLAVELNAGKTLTKAPRKATPASSPTFRKSELANEGPSSPPPHSPYVSREARCQHLFHAKTRQAHVHSRAAGIAQKQELRNYLFQHLNQGTFTLHGLEKHIRQLCCVFWKVGSRDSFMHRFIQSNTKIQALAIEQYASDELARMAGSEGHEESEKTRNKHHTLRGLSS